MEELLIEKLQGVKDGYEDFYKGIPESLKKYENGVEKLLAEFERRPDMTSSDVIEFITEEIFGIKKVI